MNEIPKYDLRKITLEAEIRSKEQHIQHIKDGLHEAEEELRQLNERYEDASPTICSCCKRGAWEPHVHQFPVGRKWKYYTAPLVPRLNETIQQESKKP